MLLAGPSAVLPVAMATISTVLSDPSILGWATLAAVSFTVFFGTQVRMQRRRKDALRSGPGHIVTWVYHQRDQEEFKWLLEEDPSLFRAIYYPVVLPAGLGVLLQFCALLTRVFDPETPTLLAVFAIGAVILLVYPLVKHNKKASEFGQVTLSTDGLIVGSKVYFIRSQEDFFDIELRQTDKHNWLKITLMLRGAGNADGLLVRGAEVIRIPVPLGCQDEAQRVVKAFEACYPRDRIEEPDPPPPRRHRQLPKNDEDPQAFGLAPAPVTASAPTAVPNAGPRPTAAGSRSEVRRRDDPLQESRLPMPSGPDGDAAWRWVVALLMVLGIPAFAWFFSRVEAPDNHREVGERASSSYQCVSHNVRMNNKGEQVCAPACGSAADCARPERCVHGECVPPGKPLGASCSEPSDCEGDLCLTFLSLSPEALRSADDATTRNACSQPCAADKPCPQDYHCVRVEEKPACVSRARVSEIELMRDRDLEPNGQFSDAEMTRRYQELIHPAKDDGTDHAGGEGRDDETSASAPEAPRPTRHGKGHKGKRN